MSWIVGPSNNYKHWDNLHRRLFHRGDLSRKVVILGKKTWELKPPSSPRTKGRASTQWCLKNSKWWIRLFCGFWRLDGTENVRAAACGSGGRQYPTFKQKRFYKHLRAIVEQIPPSMLNKNRKKLLRCSTFGYYWGFLLTKLRKSLVAFSTKKDCCYLRLLGVTLYGSPQR